MLSLFSLEQGFINFMQSGWYVDYIIKKIVEILLRNIFIYAALFFGEKYIIEFLSKKSVESIVNFSTTYIFNKQYAYGAFYFNFIVFIIIVFIAAQLFFIFG